MNSAVCLRILCQLALVQLALSFTLIPCCAQTPTTVTVIVEQAPVQIGQNVIATVKKGEELKVVEIKGDWYCVLPSRGWIHKQFLQVGIPSPEKDKPTVAAATTAGGAKTGTWEQVPLRTAAQKAKGYFGGETGQNPFTLAISPSDPNHLAIGIDTAAVYTSRDGGKSWQLRRRGIKSNGVQSIAFDPKNPRILWAAGLKAPALATDEPSDPLVDGIYRSTDGGDTWQLLRNAVFTVFLNYGRAQNEYFAFDPKSYDGKQHLTVIVATHQEGLLKTTDAGQSWRSLGLTNMHINAVIAHPKRPQRLLVAADTGLFSSDNGGQTFEKTGGRLPDSPVLGLVADPKDENIIYVALGESGIWRSADSGKSFRPRMDGIPSRKRWARLCISPANSNYLYVDAERAGGAFPFWSHNGGMSWSAPTQIEPGFLGAGHWIAEGFVAHPTNPKIAFHCKPVRKTTDGGRTWQYSNDGISGCRRATRTSLAFRPDDSKKMVFFHIDQGSALTTDGGDTFIHCPPPRQADIAVGGTTSVGAYDPTPGSRKLISAVGGWTEQRICISENDGSAWTVQPDTVGNYHFMAFHPQKTNIIYAGRTKDSLRSRDGGKTWQTLPHPIQAMFPGNGDIVFTSRKVDQFRSEVSRSSDQGETWTPLPSQIVGAVVEIDVDSRNPDRLYAAVRGGVWIFDSKSWTKRDDRHGLEKDNFGALMFGSVAVDPMRPNIIYAGQRHNWRGTARGMFRSTDSGEHWENITGNLGPDLTVWAITVSPHDGTVWIGTDYGNWKLPPPK